MASRIELLKEEMKALLNEGQLLLCALLNEVGKLPDDIKKNFKQSKTQLPNFFVSYEPWYSESLQVIKQIIPDRLDDFVNQYKITRRKSIDHETYRISDYLAQITITKGEFNRVVLDGTSAVPNMDSQLAILKSVERRFTKSLFDIKYVLQADIFDSELDAATDLNKKRIYPRCGSYNRGCIGEAPFTRQHAT